jgi:hypothetical protein
VYRQATRGIQTDRAAVRQTPQPPFRPNQSTGVTFKTKDQRDLLAATYPPCPPTWAPFATDGAALSDPRTATERCRPALRH